MLRQLGRFFDDYDLSAITPTLLAEWRTWRRTEGVTASTVNREEEILKHMLTKAVGTYLEANPIARQPRLRTVDVETRILTADEETRVLAAATDPVDKATILCGLDALMRRGSVAALARAQDHDTYVTLLNAKQGTYKVPVSVRLRKALDALPETDTLFFPGLSSADLGDRFAAVCARAKVAAHRDDGGVTFHCLRHTGASRMLAAGVDIKTVMRIGGWSSLAILQRYLHPTDAVAQAAVNLIGRTPQSRGTRKGQRKAKKSR